MENSPDSKEIKKRKESSDIKLEDKIQNMLSQVMEEKDSNESFEYDCGEIDDEFKFSRPSTRRETTQNLNDVTDSYINSTQYMIYPSSINRANKRTLTHNLNQVNNPHFSMSMKNPNLEIPRKSAQYSNFAFNSLNTMNNPNIYNNSFNSNLFLFNNNLNQLNLNQSFQSLQSFNPQFNESFINNNNLLGNNFTFNTNNNFNPQQNFFFTMNNINNINNNFPNYNESMNNVNNNVPLNNININTINNNKEIDIKRKENRKKTEDVQNNFKKKKYTNNYFNNNYNNNSNFLFRKSLSLNSNNNIYLKNFLMNNNINNEIINNKNTENNNNNINDTLIFELKHLLEHTGKIDFYIYNIIKGKIASIIKNHKGSKIFQKYLKSTHSDEILHLIFVELFPYLEQLIIDPYANYFCKKFFTFLNQKDRTDFLKGIEKSLIDLSSDSIGTYPIQSIIEHLNTKNEKNIIISGIKEGFIKLIYDAFGCHVLEKLLTCFEDEYVNFIYTYIFQNFLNLTNNSNGIYIIKKILTFTQKKNLHEKLKSIVKKNAIFLIKQ